MRLRKLKPEDAPLMLEWMHDPGVVKDLQTNFSRKTLEDCEAFIRAASKSGEDLHYAIITDRDDEYLGTVSLKHLQPEQAEFAITIRKCAMGKGVSREAMSLILRYGFDRFGLKRIYWCVSPKNQRAVRFYDKNGYQRTAPPDRTEGYTPEQKKQYLWYEVRAGQIPEKKQE